MREKGLWPTFWHYNGKRKQLFQKTNLPKELLFE